jgi:hypothetical protein
MKLVIPIISVLLIITLLSFNLLFAQNEECNTIDAFTSASIYKSLKIQPSQACKNYAIINWWEFYGKKNVFAYNIKWGKQKGVYTDSLNLMQFVPDSQKLHSVRLENLTENTEYYGLIYRDYNHDIDLRDFRFTTPPLPPVLPVPVTDPGYVSVKIKHLLPHNVVNYKINAVDIYTAAGKRIAHLTTSSAKNISTRINSRIKTPGLYIACFKNINNTVLTSQKILINR